MTLNCLGTEAYKATCLAPEIQGGVTSSPDINGKKECRTAPTTWNTI